MPAFSAPTGTSQGKLTRTVLALAGLTLGLASLQAQPPSIRVSTAKTPAADLAQSKAGNKLDAPALARLINSELLKKIAAEKAQAAPLADDAEFLRRVYLDLHGVIPTATQAADFLARKNSDKRAQLIDELLASPQFGKNFADIYTNRLLMPNPSPGGPPLGPLERWLEDAFNRNLPWNQLATDVITAKGSPLESKTGAARLYLDGRGTRQLPLADLTNTVTSVFLGVQIKCAQCHDHPFTKTWKQSDYWGAAAFFANVNYAKREVQDSTKKTGRKDFLPDNYQETAPKFLGGTAAKVPSVVQNREEFARWATSPANPYFARAMVNRMWAHFFASGFVNPVDDLRPDKHQSHPELLQALADQFAASGFDVKQLLRAICNSQAYQRTSQRSAGDETDTQLFSHMAIKTMTPEQLYDSLVTIMGGPPTGGRAGAQLDPRGRFIEFFDTATEDPTAYSRGIPHVLRLMNSNEFRQHQARLLGEVAAAGRTPAQVIDQLYLTVLSRRPAAPERERMLAFVQKQGGGNPQAAYGQVLWVLLNSSEFTLNH